MEVVDKSLVSLEVSHGITQPFTMKYYTLFNNDFISIALFHAKHAQLR